MDKLTIMIKKVLMFKLSGRKKLGLITTLFLVVLFNFLVVFVFLVVRAVKAVTAPKIGAVKDLVNVPPSLVKLSNFSLPSDFILSLVVSS